MRVPRRWYLIAIVLAVPLFAFGAARYREHLNLGEIRELEARLRAAGEPTSIMDLSVFNAPDEGNGANDLLAADAWFLEHAPPDWEQTIVGPWNPNILSPWRETSEPEQLAELAAFLEGLAPYWEGLERATGAARIEIPCSGKDATGWPIFTAHDTIVRAHQLLLTRAAVGDDLQTRLG